MTRVYVSTYYVCLAVMVVAYETKQPEIVQWHSPENFLAIPLPDFFALWDHLDVMSRDLVRSAGTRARDLTGPSITSSAFTSSPSSFDLSMNVGWIGCWLDRVLTVDRSAVRRHDL